MFCPSVSCFFHLINLKHYNDVMVIVFSIEMMVFSVEFNKGGRAEVCPSHL